MGANADLGVVGLAVMGENLMLNMENQGFTVACYNRTTSKVDDFVNGRAKGRNVVGCHSVEELCENLAKPRRIMLMVKAGKAVDGVIDQFIPYLEPGDILIDGGNSHFDDTIRRTRMLQEKGLRFIGTGVSGGEEGALHGPSIMPGGTPEAWEHVKPIFQSIAAKAPDGSPCCEWLGSDGAGHYVKMVHNGIEYGDMQMICEAYLLMSRVLGMSADEIHEVFKDWNEGELNSYLIEITRDILGTRDTETGKPMLDVILDTAGQKGTGKWTSQSALDMGTPAPTVAEAVFARCVSALKEYRVEASKILSGPQAGVFDGDRDAFIESIRQALLSSKVCSYAQGFHILRMAAEEYGWDFNYGDIALIWRAGCVIRAQFLGRIKEAFDADPDLHNLLLASYFNEVIQRCQDGWRTVVATAARFGVPTPAFSSALAYYDSYRCERLPANLLQAQRDYFGAHTYERIDKPRGEFFHTNWTGRGGTTSASTYNV